jgi:hypothetical protein
MNEAAYTHLIEKLAVLAKSYRKQADAEDNILVDRLSYYDAKADGVEAVSRLVEVLNANGKL